MARASLIRPAKGLPRTFRERRSDTASQDWRIEISVVEDVSAWGESLPEFIERLITLGEPLVEPQIEMDEEYGRYGDRDRDVLRLSGWREATEAEIEEARAKHAATEEQFAAQRRMIEDQQIAHLRQTRPELFK